MRLFLGISLPETVRAEAHARSLAARSLIPGRYGPPENYHITLAFIGETVPERLGDVQAVLESCLRRFPAPALTLGEPGFFGRPQNAILILRVQDEPPLAPLHDALTQALAQTGLPFDPGPFCPHVTLARHAAVPQPLPALPGFAPVRFTARSAHVFLSARDEQGRLAYTPLRSAPFAGQTGI